MEDGVVGVENTLQVLHTAEKRANPRILDSQPLQRPVRDRDVGWQTNLLVAEEVDLLRSVSLFDLVVPVLRHPLSLTHCDRRGVRGVGFRIRE